MFSGLFFVSAICAHENRIAPVLPFGNISFIYPHPVRLIYLPRLGPALARPCPLLGAWLAFGLPPLPVSVRGEAPFKNDPSGSCAWRGAACRRAQSKLNCRNPTVAGGSL